MSSTTTDGIGIVVCTPSTGNVKTAYAVSLARMTAYFAQVRIFPEIEKQSLDFLLLEGSGISSGREQLIQQALQKPGMTHVLFIDEDMGFDINTLHVMARRRQPIVACNYRMRVPPADFTALKIDIEKGRVQTTEEMTGLEEAYYAGFGFALIERRVFEAVEQPRFIIEYCIQNNVYTTEDHPFYRKAREAGFPCYIDHDASKLIWHVGGMNYVWNQDYTPRGVNNGERT